ncbi:response regulator [Achromobacter sp. PAB15]|uniref:response regulator n=1 Tax=Achromobacter sp. PAB15 TaxID=3233048 RepID=UPI003F8F4D50
MNVLLVDDDPNYLDTLREIVTKLEGGVSLVETDNAEQAIELLNTHFFDFIVLDMSIPWNATDTVDSAAHGMRVLTEAQARVAGTPIFVLTGSPARAYGEHVEDLLKGGAKADIWGDGVERAVMNFSLKRDLRRFEEVLANYVEAYRAIRDVELDKGSLDIREGFDRLIRVFARALDNVSCSVSQITGGLSGTPVFRLQVADVQGNVTQGVVGKLGPIGKIMDEANRYDKFANRLPPEATPRKIRVQKWGGGGDAGLFYQLAKGYDETVFSIISADDRIAHTVQQLERLTADWVRRTEQKQVCDIRRAQMSDDKYHEIVETFGIQWTAEIERKAVRTSWACTHGDMHGSNILVDEKSRPILIDFGDMSDGPSSRDPITLELSALFHSDGPLRGSGWPGDAAGAIFVDVDAYLRDCPAAEFVKACRRWTDARVASKRERLAVAYAYLVRQLKYEDTDKRLAIQLLEGVKHGFEQT